MVYIYVYIFIYIYIYISNNFVLLARITTFRKEGCVKVGRQGRPFKVSLR